MIPEIRRIGQHSALLATTKQEMFGEFLEAHLGQEYRWSFNSGVLAFESKQGRVECDTYPVASIAVEPATLLWRWQPLSAEEAEYFRGEVAEGYRQFGEQYNLASLTAAEVAYQVGDDQRATIAQLGHDVIHTGYEIFGPRAVFYQAPFNAAGSRLVWALNNFRTIDGPIDVPSPELLEVLVKAPRLLDQVDDVSWSLEGVARHFPGVQCVMEQLIPERTHIATFTESGGKTHQVRVELDDLNRIVNVKMQLAGSGTTGN